MLDNTGLNFNSLIIAASFVGFRSNIEGSVDLLLCIHGVILSIYVKFENLFKRNKSVQLHEPTYISIVRDDLYQSKF